jgi:hypothetical protein
MWEGKSAPSKGDASVPTLLRTSPAPTRQGFIARPRDVMEPTDALPSTHKQVVWYNAENRYMF